MKFELTNEFISELNELINNKDPHDCEANCTIVIEDSWNI